jgi:hypothetical protein
MLRPRRTPRKRKLFPPGRGDGRGRPVRPQAPASTQAGEDGRFHTSVRGLVGILMWPVA